MSIHCHYSDAIEALLPRIRTEHVLPPIPVRNMDWRATLDGYEPGDPMGEGPTEESAVADLLEKIADQ